MGNAATLSCQYDLEQVSDTSSRKSSGGNNTAAKDIVVGGMLNYYNYLHFVLAPPSPIVLAAPAAAPDPAAAPHLPIRLFINAFSFRSSAGGALRGTLVLRTGGVLPLRSPRGQAHICLRRRRH